MSDTPARDRLLALSAAREAATEAEWAAQFDEHDTAPDTTVLAFTRLHEAWLRLGYSIAPEWWCQHVLDGTNRDR